MFHKLLLYICLIPASFYCDPIASSTSSLTTSYPHPTVPQITSLNIDKAVPTPSSALFAQCINFIRGSQWMCYEAADSTYGVTMESFLTDNKFSQVECCALNFAERCLEVKRNTYESCSDGQVLDYFARVHQYYVDHCGSYWENGTMVAKCAALQHMLGSLLLVIFLLIPIGFCNFLFNVHF